MAGGNGDSLHGEDWDGDDDALEPTQQLPLDDEGDRLPWLESADDDEDGDGYYASATGRLLILAAAGLLAMVAIIGAIWWFNGGSGNEQLADGSVIKAPAQPYKTAPKDPGGKTFDGTGDSSFAVSEGQTRPGKLDGSDTVPATPAPTPSAAASPGPVPSASASPVQASGVGVQVGAYSTQVGAEAGWGRLVAAHGSLLSGVSHRVVAGKADIGTVYRLQAVTGDAGGANALCGQLKAAGVPCQVK